MIGAWVSFLVTFAYFAGVGALSLSLIEHQAPGALKFGLVSFAIFMVVVWLSEETSDKPGRR